MATIQLPAEQVQARALGVIDSILQARKDKAKTMIEVQMRQPVSVGFLGFKKKYMTEEEALNYLADFSYDFYLCQNVYAGNSLAKAKKLLLIAQVGDPVTLNEDDVSLLFSKE